jgi:hypothetical protein
LWIGKVGVCDFPTSRKSALPGGRCWSAPAPGPASRKPGWKGRLKVNRSNQSPQLKSLFMSDTLEDDFATERCFGPER